MHSHNLCWFKFYFFFFCFVLLQRNVWNEIKITWNFCFKLIDGRSSVIPFSLNSCAGEHVCVCLCVNDCRSSNHYTNCSACKQCNGDSEVNIYRFGFTTHVCLQFVTPNAHMVQSQYFVYLKYSIQLFEGLFLSTKSKKKFCLVRTFSVEENKSTILCLQ